jgi:hypothetical protein
VRNLVQRSGFGVESVSPWNQSASGNAITLWSVGKQIGYVGQRLRCGWSGSIGVVRRRVWSGSSLSDADSGLQSGL